MPTSCASRAPTSAQTADQPGGPGRRHRLDRTGRRGDAGPHPRPGRATCGRPPAHHETAADSLERHLAEVDRLKDAIAAASTAQGRSRWTPTPGSRARRPTTTRTGAPHADEDRRAPRVRASPARPQGLADRRPARDSDLMPPSTSPPPAPPPANLLDGLPRRVALTLPELRLVAERAGDAPLPFDVTEPAGPGPSRTGWARAAGRPRTPPTSRPSPRLHDAARLAVPPRPARPTAPSTPAWSAPSGCWPPRGRPRPRRPRRRRAGEGLAPRGRGSRRDPGHRRRDRLRAGVVPTAASGPRSWPGPAWCPRTCRCAPPAVPDHLDLPFDLANAAAEAMRTGRADLLPVLVEPARRRQSSTPTARPLADSDVQTARWPPSHDETRGRLRALVADVAAGETTVVGVVSWVLVADGWRAFRPYHARRRAAGRAPPRRRRRPRRRAGPRPAEVAR